MSAPTTSTRRDCPQGMRFLIQLVDAANEADARRILREMFGRECSRVAVLKRGTSRSTGRKCTGKPSPDGYRVYVPFSWRCPANPKEVGV